MTTLTRSAFKSGTPACTSGHRGFPDEGAARAGKKDATDFYRCSLCGLWHGVRSLSGGERGKGGRSPQKPAQRRETGFSAAVKLATRTRAGSGDPEQACCEACSACLGRYGGQVQHRLARGMGGSSDEATAAITNAALLCGTPQSLCHGLCERRDPHMHGAGFWLTSGQDPACEPILLAGRDGGIRVWLTSFGSYSTTAPRGTAE